MPKTLLIRALASGMLLCGLSACSTIKGWFPDKERDYQFTSEIPELIIPDDLKHKAAASLPVPSAPKAAAESATVAAQESSAAETDSTVTESSPSRAVAPEAAETPSADAGAPEPSQTVVASGSVSSLQVDQPRTQATRMVGRALSRQKMEIIERNIEKGYFYVNFDPNAVEAKDDNLLDEISFMFGDDPSQEEEYRITVRSIGEQLSEVTVQDSSGKTLSNAVANALLKQITDGINQVQSEQGNTDEASKDASQEGAAPGGETPAAESPDTAPAVPQN